MNKKLEERVIEFRCFGLPGQPVMHVGTSYLVNDLVREIDAQAARIAELKAAAKLFIATFPLPPYHNDSSGKRGFGKDSPIVLAYKATEIALENTAKAETEAK